MSRKSISLYFIIASNFFLSGCWSQNELNELARPFKTFKEF
ncbi:hypothetical protein ACH0B6_08510 [Solibacillus silvestris]